MKKSLHKVKAQFSHVCSGLCHAAPTMADTPGWSDFPRDTRAIISDGTSFQLFASSIYRVQTGFRSSTRILLNDGFKTTINMLRV